jgi:TolB protein
MQALSLIPSVKRLPLAIVLWLSAALSFATDPGQNGRIAFFANLTGTYQIFTVKADGSDLFRVTNLPPSNDGFAFAPDFSPDGQRIVFPHDMTGALELYVINADGTGLTQITHDGLFHAVPRWSPDGSHIVFATGGKYGLAVIATIAADGTDMKLLTTAVWESLGDKHIVFSSQQGGYVSALWIMDVNGKHQRRLTRPELEAGPPDVSPDGKQVVSFTHQDMLRC